MTGGIVTVNLVLVLTIGMSQPERPAPVDARHSTPPTTAPEPSPYVALAPQGPPAPRDRPVAADEAALDRWSRRISGRTAIPARAVTAYGRAEMWMRGKRPGCHISWTTLAAFGEVGSEHGETSKAAGPMRIPDKAWSRWAARARADGARPDRTDIGDASLTVARALCAGDADMRTANGWWTAVVGYTQSVDAAKRIFGAVRRYARAAR